MRCLVYPYQARAWYTEPAECHRESEKHRDPSKDTVVHDKTRLHCYRRTTQSSDIGSNIGFFAYPPAAGAGHGGCGRRRARTSTSSANLGYRPMATVIDLRCADAGRGRPRGSAWTRLTGADRVPGKRGDRGRGRCRERQSARDRDLRRDDRCSGRPSRRTTGRREDGYRGRVSSMRSKEHSGRWLDHRPILVSELTGEGGPAAVALLESRDYRMWDLESGRLLGDGSHPFMVAAIPEETLDGNAGPPRSRRRLGVLSRPMAGRRHWRCPRATA